ncbi:MAG: hypothetical protein L6R41_000584 [Letrouitia leprolyta]|nr:MAG: hypothetical protein L6R41_000584 [Letrouitia leprolyta]
MNTQRFPELYRPMVDEAPHLRERSVPMKVLVLGFPRTGTSSIQKALEILGLGPCYHMRTAMNEFPRDCAMWMQAFEAKFDGKGQPFTRQQWDQLLARYSSLCDLPAIAFAPELIQAYPAAKIILTDRDPDAWYASVSRTLAVSRRYWLHDVLKHLDWATGLVHPLRIKFWQCLFDDDFEKNGKEAMKRHYDEVRSCAKIQGRRVLEMRLGDGWGPLCEFLEVEIPREAYPRENTSDGFIPKMKERARLRLLASPIESLDDNDDNNNDE